MMDYILQHMASRPCFALPPPPPHASWSTGSLMACSPRVAPRTQQQRPDGRDNKQETVTIYQRCWSRHDIADKQGPLISGGKIPRFQTCRVGGPWGVGGGGWTWWNNQSVFVLGRKKWNAIGPFMPNRMCQPWPAKKRTEPLYLVSLCHHNIGSYPPSPGGRPGLHTSTLPCRQE